MKNLITLISLALSWQEVVAAVRTELVEYQQGGTTLEGLLVFDDAANAARPGVLVAHQWKGITDYERADKRSWEAMKAFFAEILR